jgi:hypothetical protein
LTLLALHLGVVVPVVSLANTGPTVVGSDFATVGLAPGVTVDVDEHWAIDIELIAQNDFKNARSTTTLMVDPGVLRRFEGFSLGLRVATQVGGPPNVGLVPVALVPFRLFKQLSYFVGLGAPVFLRNDGTKMRPSVGLQFQTGVRF